MTRTCVRRRFGRISDVGVVISTIMAVTAIGSCRRSDALRTAEPSSAKLRVGVAQLSLTSPISGVRQLTQLLSVEGLARTGEDGRLEPLLAEKWTLAKDGRSLEMTIRSGVKFHDGSPLDAKSVAAMLPDAMRAQFGSIINDVDSVTSTGQNSVRIGFRRPSPLLLEALEATIRKPGDRVIGTGPFMVAPSSTTTLLANADYYLGRPSIGEVQIATFPSVRTAWAELLRDDLDWLYEVGPDALDSLQSSTNVAVFTYTR